MGYKFNPLTSRLDLVNPSGTGDVVGPASSTDNAVARFDGITGKLIKNSSNFISDNSGNTNIAGYTRVGSLSAPLNTTAGDLTTERINIGDNANAFAGTYQVIRASSTNNTTTGPAQVAFNYSYTTNPASNTTLEHRALLFQLVAAASTGVTQGALFASRFEIRNRSDALISAQIGQVMVPMVVDSSSPASVSATTVIGLALLGVLRPSGTATVTTTDITLLDASGGTGSPILQGSITTTNFTHIKLGNPAVGTMTNLIAVDIATLTRGSTTNIGIQVGQPRLINGIGATTDSIAIKIPTASLVIGNQTATTTNAHGISIGIPTYTSTTNTRTLTNAAALYIAGAPVASTNVVITNGPYAIWVDSGTTRLDGGVQFSSGGTIYSDTNLTSGTYTPTLTNVANLDGSTAYQCQYIRIGNTVTVSGKVDVDPTLATTSTQLGISLPIASNLGATEDCAGTAFASGIAGQGAAILGDAANDRAQMQWMSTDITNQAMYFTFTYEVI